MFCSNCGKQYENAAFCPECGTPAPDNRSVNAYGQTANQAPVHSQPNNAGYNPGYNPGYSYAEPVKSVGLIGAYTGMFKNYANFSGRSRRSEYWLALVANWIILMIASVLLVSALFNEIEEIEMRVLESQISGRPFSFSDFGSLIIGYGAIVIYCLVLIIPSLALSVRRLHDTGKSGWYFLLSFVPLVGGIILLIFMATDSTPGPNKYGPNPKGIN